MKLEDLYEAQRAGASKATLIAMVEELERRGERVPPQLIIEIHELVDDNEVDSEDQPPAMPE